MHIAEQPNGKFYRPAFVGPGRSYRAFHGTLPASIPEYVRNAVWTFLERRASLLMSAPGLDMKTYTEHPPKDRLSPGEEPARVAVNTFSDEHTWPPRWGAYERHLDRGSAMWQAYSLMNDWLIDLKKNRGTNGISREVVEAINEAIERLYFASTMHVRMPERQAPDADGYCTEDINRHTLRDDAQPDLAEFACVAHNAMIALLHWIDQDIPQREEALKAQNERYRQERDIEQKLDSLIAREKRHAAAVRRVKEKLAKEKAEAERLLAEANQRMSEAMTMAALVAQIEKKEKEQTNGKSA